MTKHYYKNQPTVLETIVLGLLKAIWFLISLPFRGIKWGRGKSGLSTEEKNYITSKRLEIEKMLGSENQIELRHAVMEADKLADYTMKQKGYAGETFADRLRSAQDSMPKNVYNDAWQGHKVRNQIAHEQMDGIQNTELRESAKKLLAFIKNL